MPCDTVPPHINRRRFDLAIGDWHRSDRQNIDFTSLPRGQIVAEMCGRTRGGLARGLHMSVSIRHATACISGSIGEHVLGELQSTSGSSTLAGSRRKCDAKCTGHNSCVFDCTETAEAGAGEGAERQRRRQRIVTTRIIMAHVCHNNVPCEHIVLSHMRSVETCSSLSFRSRCIYYILSCRARYMGRARAAVPIKIPRKTHVPSSIRPRRPSTQCPR
eukprot:SAG11_NODE_438_length_9463_cov_47.214957_7_plen_217_part_00